MDTEGITDPGPLPRLNRRESDYRKSIDDCTPSEWNAASAAAYAKMRDTSQPVACNTDGKVSPLKVQVAGDHYKKLSIQPIEYIHANNLNFLEGNVVKYVTRWRGKGGLADLEKAKHYLELLMELEFKIKKSAT